MKSEEFFDLLDRIALAEVKTALAQDRTLLQPAKEFGTTPLMFAVSMIDCSPDLVKILLEAGANPNVTNRDGYTSLHYLVMSDCPAPPRHEIMRMLIKAGASVEARQYWDYTPLMLAVVEGTTEDVAVLLEVGADPNAYCKPNAGMIDKIVLSRNDYRRNGASTLMLAVTFGNAKKVELLLKSGVDLGAVNSAGQNVIEYGEALIEEEQNEYGQKVRDRLQQLKKLMVKQPNN